MGCVKNCYAESPLGEDAVDEKQRDAVGVGPALICGRLVDTAVNRGRHTESGGDLAPGHSVVDTRVANSLPVGIGSLRIIAARVGD